MRSEIITVPREKGEIQRLHLVRPESWSELEFMTLSTVEPVLKSFTRIYRQFLVPACPWLFGHMVLFCLPEDVRMPFSYETEQYGHVASPLTAAAAALEKGVTVRRGVPCFRDRETEAFWRELEKRGCVEIVSGKLPITTIIPVSGLPGYLSQAEPEARVKMNASFFIMDRFDCATGYDHIGSVIGLCVKDGVVENPPMYLREALLVRWDGSVSVEIPDIRKMDIEIGGRCYHHGKNALIDTRPRRSRTPRRRGKQLVIVGCTVAAVVTDRSVPIPASGFVLYPEGECDAKPGDRVMYRGMEDVRFGIQVGNSIVKNGEKTLSFQSRYYNIRHLEPIPFPPSLYPMNYRRDRAARMALGADREGKPMLLWAEGAAKLGHTPGVDSCGASLLEMAEMCGALGMVNGINLDGGGSAQLLLEGKRSLRISDRKAGDLSESERPVPNALIIR